MKQNTTLLGYSNIRAWTILCLLLKGFCTYLYFQRTKKRLRLLTWKPSRPLNSLSSLFNCSNSRTKSYTSLPFSLAQTFPGDMPLLPHEFLTQRESGQCFVLPFLVLLTVEITPFLVEPHKPQNSMMHQSVSTGLQWIHCAYCCPRRVLQLIEVPVATDKALDKTTHHLSWRHLKKEKRQFLKVTNEIM